MISSCVNPDHQHWTYFLVDGTNTDDLVPMACWGESVDGVPCGRPSHLNLTVGRYCHDTADPALDCDMSEPPVTPCKIKEEVAA